MIVFNAGAVLWGHNTGILLIFLLNWFEIVKKQKHFVALKSVVWYLSANSKLMLYCLLYFVLVAFLALLEPTRNFFYFAEKSFKYLIMAFNINYLHMKVLSSHEGCLNKFKHWKTRFSRSRLYKLFFESLVLILAFILRRLLLITVKKSNFILFQNSNFF